MRRVTAGDMVAQFYAWRKDGEGEATGASETAATNLVVHALDVQLCDTSEFEDEDEIIESELENSEDERDYE